MWINIIIESISSISAKNKHWNKIRLLLEHRLRRWPNTKQIMVECFVFVWIVWNRFSLTNHTVSHGVPHKTFNIATGSCDLICVPAERVAPVSTGHHPKIPTSEADQAHPISPCWQQSWQSVSWSAPDQRLVSHCWQHERSSLLGGWHYRMVRSVIVIKPSEVT